MKGKKYKNSSKLIEKNKFYSVKECVSLMKKTSTTKFDSTVELVFRLNVDPRHADQQIRGALVLPNGTGKTQKILALTKTQINEANEAKPNYIGGVELIEKIKKENWFDFDVIVATPEMMSELGKIGKILGPKGLMPNPKTGTVTKNIKQAIQEIQKGKATYRVDKDGNLHFIVGKVSFTDEKLIENYNAILKTVQKVKPATIKGKYILNIAMSTTMGPAAKIIIE